MHHLSVVLRRGPDSPISYTDGGGICGTGRLAGSHILRGEETRVPAPTPPIRVACPPPTDRARARFLVEKLAELGVDELIWLHTRRSQGRPPSPAKSRSWTAAALEQSRGSRLMAITDAVSLQSLPPQALWVAERENQPPQRVAVGDIIVIGPEGGLDRDEVPAGVRKFGLGRRVLRVETAAIAAATLFLDRSGRLRSPQAAT